MSSHRPEHPLRRTLRHLKRLQKHREVLAVLQLCAHRTRIAALLVTPLVGSLKVKILAVGCASLALELLISYGCRVKHWTGIWTTSVGPASGGTRSKQKDGPR